MGTPGRLGDRWGAPRPSAAHGTEGAALNTRVLTPVLLVLAAAAIASAAFESRYVPGLDLYCTWVAGRIGPRAGPARLYTPEGQERIVAEGRRLGRAQESPRLDQAAAYWQDRWCATGSPLLLTLHARLLPERFDAALRTHQLVSLAASSLAIVVLCRQLAFALPVTLALVALLTSAFAPLASDLTVGNVAQLQLGVLALFLVLRSGSPRPGHELAGGALLGLGTLLKPTLAVPAALLGLAWVVDGRWRSLARHAGGALAGALAGIGLAAWHFGSPAIWPAWLPMLTLRMPGLDLRITEGNLAPAALVEAGTGLATTPLLAGLLVAGAAVALWRSRGAGSVDEVAQRARERSALALGCTVLLLGSPLVWVHYHVLAILPFLVALDPAGATARMSRRATWLALAAVAPLVALDLVPRVPDPAIVLAAGCTAVGTLLLYGLLLWQLGLPAAAAPRRAASAGRRRP